MKVALPVAVILSFALNADVISLQLNPSSQAVSPGDVVSVTLEIGGIGTPIAMEVGSFDSFVGFNSSLLTPIGVTFGSFLGDPGAFEALTTTSTGPDSVEAAEVSLLPTSLLDSLQTFPDFMLATYSFQAVESGMAQFTYLGGPVDDGNGHLIAGTKTITPEPALFWLEAAGAFCLTFRVLLRSKR